MKHTFAAGIGLHELVPRAGLFEFGRQPGQLRQDLVHDPHVRGQAVAVQVGGQEAADVAQAADDQHRRFAAGVVRHDSVLWVGLRDGFGKQG